MDGRDEPGHDDVRDSQTSNSVVMAALVAAIHVLGQPNLLAFARAPLRQTRAKEPPSEKIKIWTVTGHITMAESSPFA